MKKNTAFISGLSLETNNRGTQALGYGSLTFLRDHEKLTEDVEVISPGIYKNPARYWKKRIRKQKVNIDGTTYSIKYRMYWLLDVWFVVLYYRIFGTYSIITPFGRDVKAMKYTAAICGGDGFSDIYVETTMKNHLYWILLSKQLNKPYIFLPQTIGPFHKDSNYKFAESLLKTANKVYVRDSAFIPDLQKMEVPFVLCDDLSYYMESDPVDIEILPHALGINISGLCYYNAFHNLAGKFENYKLLLLKIVEYYQQRNTTIYLIPHSYNFFEPENNADDLEATKDFYNCLVNKDNVWVIDADLKSPQIKYLISRMSFFIGSRMHSCFAAIYTGTPIFGLGYSYKYPHNFSRYGFPENLVSVVDLKKEEIPLVVEKIAKISSSILEKRHNQI